jgi:AraC-like DNA-binding protein
MGRALLIQMLIDIARLTIANLDNFPVNAPPFLVKVFDFIENNYTKPISLSDLAIAMNLSASHLATTVREMTGRTVLEWIKERRMAEARRLLLETDGDMAQIAEAVGYQDENYFIRQFRQVHLTTPRVWRQTHR